MICECHLDKAILRKIDQIERIGSRRETKVKHFWHGGGKKLGQRHECRKECNFFEGQEDY